MTHFTIEPQGPFSFALATTVLARLPMTSRHARTSTAEQVRMAFSLDGTLEPVAVRLRWDGRALRGSFDGEHDAAVVKAQVARIFSLDHDARPYVALGAREPRLGVLQEALPGLRPVCFPSPYDAAVSAVISQRIAGAQAAAILDRLLLTHGHAFEVDGETVRALPPPAELGRVREVAGLSAIKVQRLHAVAAAAEAGVLDAERLLALGPEAAMRALRTIPGIGPFWSEGIYMRACGTVDHFPDEPISIAALGTLYGDGPRPDATRLAQRTEAFRPFRSWVCFLLRVAAGRGWIDGLSAREGELRRGLTRRRAA